MKDWETYVLFGSYIFTAVFGSGIYKLLAARIDQLWTQITNHQQHEIDSLKERLNRLEER